MRMLIPFMVLALPLLEIAGFVVVGSQIGVLATLGLVIATSILGAVLMRRQGLGLLARIRSEAERGNTPGRELVHGLMILVAGALLLLPGFITDIAGLLLFVPAVRDFGWRAIRSRVVVTRGPARRGGPQTIDLDGDEFSRDPSATNDTGPRRLRP